MTTTSDAQVAAPPADQHRLSQRQQYDTMIQAEAGPSYSTAAAKDPASLHSHPSYPFTADLCARYPSQSAPLFQTYLDLKHAASWTEVEPLELLLPQSAGVDDGSTAPSLSKALNDLSPADLVDQTLAAWKASSASRSLVPGGSEGGWAAIRARKQVNEKLLTVLPVHISQHLSPRLFKDVFDILDRQKREAKPGDAEIETQSILVSMMAADSTLVYYSLARGLVKPVN